MGDGPSENSTHKVLGAGRKADGPKSVVARKQNAQEVLTSHNLKDCHGERGAVDSVGAFEEYNKGQGKGIPRRQPSESWNQLMRKCLPGKVVSVSSLEVSKWRLHDHLGRVLWPRLKLGVEECSMLPELFKP